MLASNHDGEVLNAAKALVRFAAALGLKVQDLIAVTEKISPPPQPHQDQPRRQERPFDGNAYEAYRTQSAAHAASSSTFTQKDLRDLIDRMKRENWGPWAGS